MALIDRVAHDLRSNFNSTNREDLVSVFRSRLLEEIELDEVANLELPQQRARLERVLSRIISFEGPVMSSKEKN